MDHGLVVKVEGSQSRGRRIKSLPVPYTEWNEEISYYYEKRIKISQKNLKR